MLVRSRAPLRLGLAGGGTDVPPFCDLYGGSVLNATIDLYAYATIESSSDRLVCFHAADEKQYEQHSAESSLPMNGKLNLHRAVYNRVVQQYNQGQPIAITLTTHCDAPPGSGLGSSSTIVVAMLRAFVELLNIPLGEYEIAHTAYEIERIDVGLNGGKQDQYAATFGGFNFMEFHAGDRVIVNPLRVKGWIISELESSLLLVHTGVSRDSATIIDEQTKNVTQNDQRSINAMHQVKLEAVRMKECILTGDFKQLARSMDDSWNAKKQMAHNISNPRIEEIYQSAKNAGAYAGKVSGAGGGGFMFFLIDPVNRMQIVRALQGQDCSVVNCHFTEHGAQGWRV